MTHRQGWAVTRRATDVRTPRLRLDDVAVQTQLIDQAAEFGRPRQECIGAGIDW